MLLGSLKLAIIIYKAYKIPIETLNKIENIYIDIKYLYYYQHTGTINHMTPQPEWILLLKLFINL
jgi:hypothetical protein